MDDKVCKSILELLHSQKNDIYDAEWIYESITADSNDINDCIDYLEEEGYIRVGRQMGSHFAYACITSKGRRVFLPVSDINPPMRKSEIFISGNQNIVGNNISVNNSFNSVIEQLKRDSDLDQETKDKVVSLIEKFTEELRTREKGKASKTFFDIIVQSGSKIGQKVIDYVIDGIFTKMT